MPCYLYGVHTTHTLLQHQPERIKQIFIHRSAPLDPLRQLAQAQGIAIQTAPRERLDQLVGAVTHQGVVAEITAPPPWLSEASLLAHTPPHQLLVLLDGVLDPGNLGACIRSIYGAGGAALLLPKQRCAPLNAAARKVACGAAELLAVVQINNIAQSLKNFKTAGYWIVGTTPHAQPTLYDCDLSQPTLLVMGGEASGMRRLTEKSCDHRCCIPMQCGLNALSVAAACAISCFEVARQQRAAGKRS